MDRDRLVGVWYHSIEEDQDDRLVYRGPGFEFPRSRAARDSITFHDDGTASAGSAGPVDAAQLEHGAWALDGETLTMDVGGVERTYEVESAAADALVLRRITQDGGR
jgi:hypothetical protein